jgi:DNA invertase Pin-like site-specific DNA recombinase
VKRNDVVELRRQHCQRKWHEVARKQQQPTEQLNREEECGKMRLADGDKKLNRERIRRGRLVERRRTEPMKRAALYCRVSTIDQHPETQLGELRQFAANRFEIVGEYTDHGFSGTRARRPELDRMMDDARRHKFDVLLVWSCDRLARSTKHLLQTIDELNGFGIQFLSQREAIDTEGPLGRAILVIVSAMAELERCIIIERVRAGMRRARLEGRQIGRARLDVDRRQVIDDRRSGMSLTQVAKKHGISRASVCRLMKEASGNSSSVLLEGGFGQEAHA